MFFYIEDMDEQGGPFTFLPKSLSESWAKDKRYTDEILMVTGIWPISRGPRIGHDKVTLHGR
jgi:hypothetical protein